MHSHDEHHQQPPLQFEAMHSPPFQMLGAGAARHGGADQPWLYWLLASVSTAPKPLVLAGAGAGIALLTIIDYLTHPEISVVVFSLVPLAVVTWSLGRSAAILFAILVALVWHFTHALPSHTFAQPAILYWNTFIRLSLCLVVILLLSSLKQLMEVQRTLAYTDFLTGAVNRRAFHDLASVELERLRRYGRPFTVAHLDIDNFKAVNDQWGHTAGDMLLQTVARTMADTLRSADTLARLGGDEFAILLPHTDSDAAYPVMSRLQERLRTEMQQHHLPITFSGGVVTYVAAPQTTDDLLRVVDEVMYEVKRGQKNAVHYRMYDGDSTRAQPPAAACGTGDGQQDTRDARLTR